WPNSANGRSRCGPTASASPSTKGASRVNAGSQKRASRPGSWMGQTSIESPIAPAQSRYIDAPPPAYGKQTSRTAARDHGRTVGNQRSAGLAEVWIMRGPRLVEHAVVELDHGGGDVVVAVVVADHEHGLAPGL